jgi:hypothetical protein
MRESPGNSIGILLLAGVTILDLSGDSSSASFGGVNPFQSTPVLRMA